MERDACTFIGHSQLWGMTVKLESKLLELIESIIVADDVRVFYCGGMGEFDLLCASVVRKLKRKYDVQLVLVIPYMTQDVNMNGDYYYQQYDDIIRPEELMGVHYKSAITKRNHWMVDHSKYALCFVRDNYGGAYKTLTYAKKKDISIINLAENI